jgi:hypothetical protein
MIEVVTPARAAWIAAMWPAVPPAGDEDVNGLRNLLHRAILAVRRGERRTRRATGSRTPRRPAGHPATRPPGQRVKRTGAPFFAPSWGRAASRWPITSTKSFQGGAPTPRDRRLWPIKPAKGSQIEGGGGTQRAGMAGFGRPDRPGGRGTQGGRGGTQGGRGDPRGRGTRAAEQPRGGRATRGGGAVEELGRGPEGRGEPPANADGARLEFSVPRRRDLGERNR